VHESVFEDDDDQPAISRSKEAAESVGQHGKVSRPQMGSNSKGMHYTGQPSYRYI
jgi:hypothetical protein